MRDELTSSQQSVFEAVTQSPAASIADIAKATWLGKTTIKAALKMLTVCGLLVKTDTLLGMRSQYVVNRGGRPSHIIDSMVDSYPSNHPSRPVVTPAEFHTVQPISGVEPHSVQVESQAAPHSVQPSEPTHWFKVAEAHMEKILILQAKWEDAVREQEKLMHELEDSRAQVVEAQGEAAARLVELTAAQSRLAEVDEYQNELTGAHVALETTVKDLQDALALASAPPLHGEAAMHQWIGLHPDVPRTPETVDALGKVLADLPEAVTLISLDKAWSIVQAERVESKRLADDLSVVALVAVSAVVEKEQAVVSATSDALRRVEQKLKLIEPEEPVPVGPDMDAEKRALARLAAAEVEEKRSAIEAAKREAAFAGCPQIREREEQRYRSVARPVAHPPQPDAEPEPDEPGSIAEFIHQSQQHIFSAPNDDYAEDTEPAEIDMTALQVRRAERGLNGGNEDVPSIPSTETN